MNILVFNVGSTTLKFACINAHSGHRLSKGLVDRIGQAGGDAPNHAVAARIAWDRLKNLEITAIGHRIVQGGDRFTTPTTVNDRVRHELVALDTLAPLHNPLARAVVEAINDLGLSIPQVLVFDTAYFATLPPKAYRYAIAESAYREHGIRRFGFHGTSHGYVTERAIAFLGDSAQAKRIISLHLGGGASAAASIDGVAVETSMGMTPLEGLVMATRTGDIDAAVPLHLMRQTGKSADTIDHLLNMQSGLLGLCGDMDMRTVLERRNAGDASATLAIDIYVHRILKYIGSYFAILGGLDALVFTAGVGEHSAEIRKLVTAPLAHLGIVIAPDVNESSLTNDAIVDLSQADAAVRTLVVPTNEERAIAKHVLNQLTKERLA
ncbi:Acetate kinase [Novipirellula galeiformis]|uniref:Acetate kinase n=1 Tax=Novipirellula galeiformis TaxID=2528004 RepID=A0A5C6CLU2_9BACT|nr:acetate/propionate family kinase [Novipirellula galeiformis]TWU24414.1 Acetate kinase [Novipirellula galeiformis]